MTNAAEQWISVDDRLPLAEHQYVLVSGHNNTQFVSLWFDGKFLRQSASKILHGVTHWMPLPKPPEQDDV